MAGEELVPAFVLHRRRYGDSSLLLELLTVTDGRISMVARGAASLRSRRRALLQPFIPLLVAWRGRGAVKTLTRAETDGRDGQLAGKALFSGFYVNELLMRLVPPFDPVPLLFQHYRHTLKALRQQDESLDKVLREFELRLLDELGYAPDLLHDDRGTPIMEEGYYRYHHESGFEQIDVSTNGAFSGKTLLGLARGESLEGEYQHQARILMRTILAFYLGARPLKSRELFRTMQPDLGTARKIS